MPPSCGLSIKAPRDDNLSISLLDRYCSAVAVKLAPVRFGLHLDQVFVHELIVTSSHLAIKIVYTFLTHSQ